MKPVEVLYSMLCCLCLPCRKKTRDLGDKLKKAHSTEAYDYSKVDMDKVYGRLRKRRVSQVPSVFEIFPCQWTPESASSIKNGDNSVDFTLKDGDAEVRIFGRFKVINVAEEMPPSVAHDCKLPVEPRNRRKRRERKQKNPIDVDFTWDFGEEEVAGEIPRFEGDTCDRSAQPEILPQKPETELIDAPQEGRTEVRVIGRFNVTDVLEEISPLEDDACKLTVNAETICKKEEVEFVDLPKEDPAEVDAAGREKPRQGVEEGAAEELSSRAAVAASSN
ncbi:uncharacterized protein LOC126320497 [Schistocerca gregaria]|uniref:uncharacterized protein LOC126320497 n=1 Tax=Schistocerca gregaria TaxID=7010 RepID=UPI00211DE1A5|nr:uncharacterized protein LOC126320497 [Schistocerca gregaria]